MEEKRSQFEAQWLDMLACPACHGELRFSARDSEIACLGCGRRYPLIDDIPVLIRERGERRDLQ